MRYNKYFLQASVICIGLCAALTGCMVGPDFYSPAPPKTKHYTKPPKPTKTVSIPGKGSSHKAQHFIAGRDIPGQWWYLFHSPEINRLIRKGLLHNPNLAAAKASLVQAKENLNAQIGSTMLPAVSANLSGTRERLPPIVSGLPTSEVYNLFDASVNISYTLDVFGGLRRQIEADSAQVDFQKYELDAAYLTLTANIVTTSITTASLREQIKATIALIKSQEETMHITEKQFQYGSASRNDVLTQQAQIAQLRATLPPLRQQLAQNMHALAVLVGTLPSEAELPSITFEQISLPQELPISLPSRLARQRPDVQASEALLHVASANIGVATANMYPQITLNGGYGWEGPIASNLLSPKNLIWNGGATLMQSIFNGGALFARKRAAIAAYEAAAAQYRQTVLQAFQNVADTLRALEHDAETLREQQEAEIASHDALALTKQQYELGGISYLNLLIAERTYQQARIARIQAEASRYADTAALFQALGGGWWRRRPLDCNKKLCRNLSQYKPGKFGK